MAAQVVVGEMQGLLYESAHMCTLRRVELAPPLPTGLDESCEAKLGQVLADARGRRLDGGRQAGYVVLAGGEHPQQPKPRRLGKQRECFGRCPYLLRGRRFRGVIPFSSYSRR